MKKPEAAQKGAQEEDPESALITPAETREMLHKTFNYFKRALVQHSDFFCIISLEKSHQLVIEKLVTNLRLFCCL